MASNYHTDNDIPRNADKLLFVHDLMKYVTALEFPAVVSPRLNVDYHEKYLGAVYSAFNYPMTQAVDYLHATEKPKLDLDFKNILASNRVNIDGITKTEKKLRKTIFGKIPKFTHGAFLKYSVSLAIMACSFWTNGIANAREICMNHILLTLGDYSFNDPDFREKMRTAALDYGKLNSTNLSQIGESISTKTFQNV